MALPIIYTWPTSSTQAISQTQTLGSAGNLMINGSLASGGQVVFNGYARTVSLTSSDDLSGVTFIISGTLNGINITDTIVSGPHANTIESDLIFDSVTSISTNAAATNISAGIGTTGRTAWFKHYHNTICPDFAMQVTVTNNINYTFVTTLNEVINSAESSINLFTPVSDMIGATTNLLEHYMMPSRFSAIQINSSDDMGSLTAIFLQQGII